MFQPLGWSYSQKDNQLFDWVGSKLTRTGATNCVSQSDKIFLGAQFEHMVVLPFEMGDKGGTVAQGVI